MDLSICIPTYRRNDQLAELLSALQSVMLPAPELAVRILVIDNNPGGEARPVVEAAAAKVGPYPISYIHETRPGVTHVRNRALSANASTDFLVFIDDDELPTREWLSGLWATWEETRAAAVFGPVRAVYGPDAPAWMVENGIHDCRVDGNQARAHPGFTNNCLIHLPTVRRHGLAFDPALTLIGGEDIIFFDGLLQRGERLANAPDAWLTEKVPPVRARTDWLKQRWRREGASDAMLYGRRSRTNSGRVRAFVQAMPRLVIGGGLTALTWIMAGGQMSQRVASALYTFQRGRGMLDYAFDRQIQEYARPVRPTPATTTQPPANGANAHG
ncbi:MAG: glycosyltransferase family 2 protein [Pseudomonadota bacterium]